MSTGSNQIYANDEQLYQTQTAFTSVATNWENEAKAGEFSTGLIVTFSKTHNIVNILIRASNGLQTVAGSLKMVALIPEIYRPDVEIYMSVVTAVTGALLDPPALVKITPSGEVFAYPSYAQNNFPISATYEFYSQTTTYPLLSV